MSRHYRLEITSGPSAGQIVRLSKGILSIGRGRQGESRKDWLLLDDQTVSRQHARLHWLPAERSYLLEHLSSTNSTLVNGREVRGTILVGDGARIQMGRTELLLKQEVVAISLGAKLSLPAETHPPKAPEPEVEPPYYLQLLPSGSKQPLQKEQPNRLGDSVAVIWQTQTQRFVVGGVKPGSASIYRYRESERNVISIGQEPVILEKGDILNVDFCQFRYGESAETLSENSQNQRANGLSHFQIPGYTIVAPLGQGATGDVLHMKDANGKSVAVKFLRHTLILNQEAMKRFRRETKVALSIKHPHLLNVLDAGQTTHGQPYLVSEYLEGETLAALTERTRVLDFPTVVKVASDLGAALSYLHSKELIHRDVKPDNIFVQKGRAILMDYGIVRGADLTAATATGSAIGTPYYMAPEQFRGTTGPECDQYALGGVLFELLAGRKVFESDDVFALAFMHVSEEPPQLKQFRPDLPVMVSDILARMLSKAPDARFPSVNEAIQALQRVSDTGV